MVKVIDDKHPLRFSDRYFLGQKIKAWFFANNAKDCPMNAVIWLDTNRLIDRVKARRFIEVHGLKSKKSS